MSGERQRLERLATEISDTRIADAALFATRRRKLAARLAAGRAVDRGLPALEADIAQSRADVTARLAAVPDIVVPDTLPIAAHRDELARTIAANPVTIVCGDTGSGKSTQLPKICLGMGRGARGMIGHTQPRRIAARAIAARVAAELEPAGEALVGYKIRFDDSLPPRAMVGLMTDGILLAELRGQRELLAYDTLIIDEAHERSLNIDFLLGYLHRLLPRRPDLRVVIASATLDPQRLAAHFGAAPVVEVSGRAYPIDVRYRPGDEDTNNNTAGDGETLAGAVEAALAEVEGDAVGGAGDVLVFCATEREIREVSTRLRRGHTTRREILPLYGRLPAAEQDKVLKPGAAPRVVLATNVAETSLTVPGVTAVIDAGLARISRYSYRSKLQRIPIEPIAQASADQRKGRCGRVAPGLCIRLYSEQDFAHRPAFTEPEIKRTNLASVILQMAVLGLGEIGDFPFVDPPDPRFVRDGERLLHILGALDAQGQVSAAGRAMAHLPLDPRLARILLAGGELGCLREMQILASGLSIQDPRERPAAARAQADERHAQFADRRSDFLAYLRLWDAWQALGPKKGSSARRRWCKERSLSYPRMREWEALQRQLARRTRKSERAPQKEVAGPAAVHRALLYGLIDRIGLRDGERDYVGARQLRFRIFPGSGLAGRRPRWIVAATLLETSRVWALEVAAVRRAWIAEAGAHVLTRNYAEPHWNEARGRVEAFERVSLFGLVLFAKRRVDFGNIDPVRAREVFISDALVAGRMQTRAAFAAHNAALMRELHTLEARLRRREIVAGPAARYEFFAARLPAGICTRKAFERWRKKCERAAPRTLFFAREDLVASASALRAADDVAQEIVVDGNRIDLRYRFEPGHAEDGVSLRVPRELLPALPAGLIERLAPGGLADKIQALVRGLAKPQRRALIPAQAFAQAAASAIGKGEERLASLLSTFALGHARAEVPPEAWDMTAIEEWMRALVQVVDDDGAILDQDRDLDALRARLGTGRAAIAGVGKDWRRDGVTTWDFEALPQSLSLRRGGLDVQAWPALEDRGDSVSLRVLEGEAAALAATRRGLARLAALNAAQQAKMAGKALQSARGFALLVRALPATERIVDDFVLRGFARFMVPAGEDLPRDEASFHARLADARAGVVPAAERDAAVLLEALRYAQDLRGELARDTAAGADAAVRDLRAQLEQLFTADFLWLAPDPWLAQYPRYLRAAVQRLENLRGGAARDQQGQAVLAPRLQRWLDLPDAVRQTTNPASAVLRYRWLVEELRVSLFAQRLGTFEKVSAQRIDKFWETLFADLRERGLTGTGAGAPRR